MIHGYLTTGRVALVLGVTTARVRQLVAEGRLRPLVRSAHPMVFVADEVEALRVARLRPAERALLDRATMRLDALAG